VVRIPKSSCHLRQTIIWPSLRVSLSMACTNRRKPERILNLRPATWVKQEDTAHLYYYYYYYYYYNYYYYYYYYYLLLGAVLTLQEVTLQQWNADFYKLPLQWKFSSVVRIPGISGPPLFPTVRVTKGLRYIRNWRTGSSQRGSGTNGSH